MKLKFGKTIIIADQYLKTPCFKKFWYRIAKTPQKIKKITLIWMKTGNKQKFIDKMTGNNW